MAATRIDSVVGTHDYDGLIVGTEPAPLTSTIKVAANKTLKRGTVVCAAAAGGDCDAVAAALANEVVYILADDVKTGAAAQTAEAYKTGCFARNKLITDGTYQLAAADIEYLRKSGIQTEDVL